MSRRNCSNNFCKEELDRLNDRLEVELEGGMCRERYPLGSAYVPKQRWGKTYEAGVALREGTVFPELNLVFCGVRGNR